MPAPWEEYASAAAPAAGTPPWQEYAAAAPAAPNEGSDALGGLSQGVLNLLAGGVRGAGSIGATLAYPVDKAMDLYYGDRGKNLSYLVTGKELPSRNEERRARLDENLQQLTGAQPDSLMYKGGKLAGEVAGTAGAGGLLAKPFQALSGLAVDAGVGSMPTMDAIATALQTGGFRTGGALRPFADTLTRIGAGAAVGGTSAGMVNPGDAPAGAMIGGALPGLTRAAGWGGNALKRAMIGQASPDVAGLAQRAADLGITVPADRLVNSRPMNAVAASLNYVPFSGRAATEDAMNSQFNQALSRTFGQDSPNVTLALRKASDDLGGKFESVLKNNTVRVDPQFVSDLADSANKASRELGTDGASIIGKQVDDIMAKATNGEIDGQAAYNIKRTLDRIGNRNSPEAYYATDLKKALMGALDRSLGPQEAAAFAQTRQHYGNMLDLEKLAPNGMEGGISAARIANMRGIDNPQLKELADIAAQFVKPREGAHGAAQRVFGAGGAGMAAGLAGIGVPGAAAAATGAAGVMGAGRVANSILNSNFARRTLLNSPAVDEPLGMLTQGVYRTSPLLNSSQ